jgi:TolB-like protein/Flp pilus assembly protein TadD
MPQPIVHPEPTAAQVAERGGRTLRLDGEHCAALRRGQGLSREALANLARGADALSLATIKRAESGLPIYPSSAAALANLLDVPLAELLGGGGSAPAAPDPRGASQAAIAVLPFEAIGGGAPEQAFADGLVEDLISRLGGSWFPVIARGSSFSFRGQSSSAREIGRLVGARYLIEGSVRRDGRRLRITARLVESESGRQLWASTHDAEYREALALQDRLTAELVAALGGQVLAAEELRALCGSGSDLDGYELALRGVWHFHRRTQEDQRAARALLLRALEHDSRLPLAHYFLVLSLQHDLLNQWSPDPGATCEQLRAHAEQFERAAPGNPFMYVAMAYSCIAHGERDEAIARLEQALALDPNSVFAHSLYGQALAMAGRADAGIHELGLALRLSPRDPESWAILATTGLAHFAAGRYEEAVRWAERAVRDRPQIPFCHAALAASLAMAGDLEAARRAFARMRKLKARMSSEALAPLLASTETEIGARYAEGLRRAGLTR